MYVYVCDGGVIMIQWLLAISINSRYPYNDIIFTVLLRLINI